MPFYMTQFSYTPEAWAAMTRKPEDRSTAVKALVEAAGGRLIGMYFCFGEYDALTITEGLDNIGQAAGVLAAVAPGHLRSIKTTVLLSISEAMEGMRKAGTITFKGPRG